MALLLAKETGSQAFVLVDTGHHYQGQNIEQIVAWLLDERRLGGFHFNDRRYADDDLTLGSIDPYQVFRIFHEIQQAAQDDGGSADLAFMVDQSHNLKGKIEAMIQTVRTAQADTRPLVSAWAVARGRPADPLQAFRESGYLDAATRQRGDRNLSSVTSYA